MTRLLVMCVAASLLARAAGAEEPTRAARAHYDAGVRRYNLGDFPAAAGEFRDAYRLSPAPSLIFDIAQAYRAARDYAQARRYYTLYLQLTPGAPERAYIDARLDEMSGAESGAPPPLLAPPERAPVAGIERRSERGPRIAGLVVAGAGVALLGTSVWFALTAASDAHDVTELLRHGHPWDEHVNSLYQEAHRAETTAIVSAAVGGALVIGGGLYLWLHRAPPRVHGGDLAVVPSARSVAVKMSWRF